MGVMGSYCQLCRLPVQHDHYVQEEGGQMLKIYRGEEPDGGHTWSPNERIVRFGPEHAWLEDAIGLDTMEERELWEGRCSDGVLTAADGESVFVADGDEDALVYHRVCWSMFGSPRGTDAASTAIRANGTPHWAAVEAYGGQLFELADLVDHGFGWMLVDPNGSTPDAQRSRDRITAALAEARASSMPEGEPTTVAEVLIADRDWRGVILRRDGQAKTLIHYRTAIHPSLDCATYPALVWAMVEYGAEQMPTPEGFQALAAFEAALTAAVQNDHAAIHVMTTIGPGQAQFLVYAKDEAATQAAISAIPTTAPLVPVDFDNEADPTWARFFDEMNPRRYIG